MKNPSVAKLAKDAGSPMKAEFDIKNVVPQPPKPPKLNYDDAYVRRDLNLYGELSKNEFIREAERQKAGGKVPTKPMKTGQVKKIEPKVFEPKKTTMKPVSVAEPKKRKKIDPLNRRKKLPGQRKTYNPRLNRFE